MRNLLKPKEGGIVTHVCTEGARRRPGKPEAGTPARRTVPWPLAGLVALAVMAAPVAAQAKAAPESFADLASKLLPSVVNISTTQTLEGRGGVEMPQLPRT